MGHQLLTECGRGQAPGIWPTRCGSATRRLWHLRWSRTAPQLAAADVETEEETLRGILQQV
jgi:hypothetical protein